MVSGFEIERQTLLEACEQAFSRPSESYLFDEFTHPAFGPQGEPLSVGVWRFRPGAEKMLVVISGTHGLECPAGWLVQMALVRNDDSQYSQSPFLRQLPPSVGLTFIHGVNPWGCAWGRRVDHHNVDVNRGSGVDFVTRSDYETIRDLVEPKKWNNAARKKIQEALQNRRALDYIKDAVSGGQYDHPCGLFYGGQELCWSAQVIEKICCDLLASCRRVAIADIHTGLGIYAQMEIISPLTGRQDVAMRRTSDWFARSGLAVRYPNAEEVNNLERGVSSPITGDLLNAMMRFLPATEVTPIAVEIGTIPVSESLPLLVAENFAYHYPDQLSDGSRRQIYCQIKRAFFPNDDLHWQQQLVSQTVVTAGALVAGLAD